MNYTFEINIRLQLGYKDTIEYYAENFSKVKLYLLRSLCPQSQSSHQRRQLGSLSMLWPW